MARSRRGRNLQGLRQLGRGQLGEQRGHREEKRILCRPGGDQL
jgi:hypothetical protein